MAADAADIVLSKPAVHTEGRPHLRVLGTEITLLDGIRERAEADLGITIGYETLDFLGAQQKAATQPGAFDIYDQCFHSLDIVWFWKAIQPIDTGRITHWAEVNDLTKTGRLSADAMIGRGDAPVKKLYVQPDRSLGPQPSRHISMLPAVHNVDAFAYDPTVVPPGQPYDTESWGWLLDERWRGRVALVDEPAIGVFDAALALQARGEASFADIGNMTLAEIDRLIDILIARKRQGHFCGFWQTMADAKRLMVDHRAAIQSSWAPAAVALSGLGVPVREAAPREGYRAWHGGLCIAAPLSGRALDVAYAYLNWWLSGWPGAVMARQGYYMSIPKRVRPFLDPAEWDYWYEGKPAAKDLEGTDGRVAVKAGAVRSGGSYWRRASRIAVWNTVMDEHNYLARRWSELTGS